MELFSLKSYISASNLAKVQDCDIGLAFLSYMKHADKNHQSLCEFFFTRRKFKSLRVSH